MAARTIKRDSHLAGDLAIIDGSDLRALFERAVRGEDHGGDRSDAEESSKEGVGEHNSRRRGVEGELGEEKGLR